MSFVLPVSIELYGNEISPDIMTARISSMKIVASFFVGRNCFGIADCVFISIYVACFISSVIVLLFRIRLVSSDRLCFSLFRLIRQVMVLWEF